jgi:uncharacterized protein YbjT (DUF2867 family)
MRVLLTGATGFIGSAVRARLLAESHEVVAVARRPPPASGQASRPAPCQPGLRWIAVDMARTLVPEAWMPHLEGIDAAVNCAGVLQDGWGDSTAGVHVAGAAALFTALERAGVRRVVHVSALGIDRSAATAFAATKLGGDRALAARDLDWVILRPSVVIGPAAYGGSALLRGLAGLPFPPRLPEAGRLQVVQLQDLVETVVFCLRPEAPTRLTLEVCGPEALELADIVAMYRRWLGFGEARPLPVPAWLLRAVSRVGDGLGLLGWRAPVRTTARIELAQGSEGDPASWMAITGIRPKSLALALAEVPASVQERWFARLYLAKAAVLAVLALFWLLTGLLTLGPAWDAGVGLLNAAGAAAAPLAAAGAAADILIGLGIAVRATARRALQAGLALSAVYLAAGTLVAPALWADPLGPLLKIVPIMALSLAALAIVDDR